MRDGHRNDCKTCNRETPRRATRRSARHIAGVKRWQQENSERLNAYRREYRSVPRSSASNATPTTGRTYGKTADEVDEIVELQGGRCLICKSELPERLASRHLDHDHTTGKIRGVLCIDCNHGIGKLKDSPDLLHAGRRVPAGGWVHGAVVRLIGGSSLASAAYDAADVLCFG